ncbi:TetR/AcrR family transcriptional regulator [Amycolatopsis cihanbeyliensis]|uniref:TetR family transcriptional regulator n=1 Tax=Amycolatopsis cihanbeyliensis TaxID=1128664 RepID=A0A542CTX2_AMYCI|nr:TetR/AcrR family transcriptional regulator [Amycolatopsis cihanbeyliensis]TQI94275.1 TetR family transcriptional regulator [Amycolatopsis cihanbeyliensis]
MPENSRPRRRADAERSRAAILRAAATVLGRQPDAGIDEIARAAGVTRQTVYAHFSTRDKLVEAVLEQVTAEVVAAMDTVTTGEGESAAAVLVRLLDVSTDAAGRYPLLGAQPIAADTAHDLHGPIVERFAEVIRRGRRSGEFGCDLPLEWLLAAIIALAHTAADEVTSGTLPAEEARRALSLSVSRLLW